MPAVRRSTRPITNLPSVLLLLTALLACKSDPPSPAVDETLAPQPRRPGQLATQQPQSVVAAPAVQLPPGSYFQTCRNCVSTGTLLTCSCKDRAGHFLGVTSVGTSCPGGEIQNLNGRLQCITKPAAKPKTKCICSHGRVYGPEPDPNVFNGGCQKYGCKANYRCQASNGNCVCKC